MTPAPVQVWLNNQFLVQVFDESLPGVTSMRLSVCRTTLNMDGRWQDNIRWDELQDIKRAVGFGDWYGIEIYPKDADVVNVANMRHLWLMPESIGIGWDAGKR